VRLAVFHNQGSGGARRALAGFCQHLQKAHSVDVYALSTADDVWVPDSLLGNPTERIAYRVRTAIRFGLWMNDLRRTQDADNLDTANRRAAAAIDAGGYDAVLVDACRFSLVPTVLLHLRTPAAYYVHNGPAWLEEGAWAPSKSRYERARDCWHGPIAGRLDRRMLESQASAVAAAGS
jgi:hypothetical protein